jgi:DNA-binding transcriptional regulator PaaX
MRGTVSVSQFGVRQPAHAPLPDPLKAVLRHFRAQRPLRGGSLLVTIFGDAIAPRGGIVTLGSLIRLAAPFGLTERLVRTAAARLARDGWLAAERSGRHSEYRLSRAGAERFAEATLRIYAPAPQTWDRGWTLLMLPAGRPRPAELREGLKWLGFGQLSAAVFAHPGTTPEEARRWLLKMPGAADALLLHARGVDALSERRLAAQGWDLAELGRRYQRFLGRFQPLVPIVHARGLSSRARCQRRRRGYNSVSGEQRSCARRRDFSADACRSRAAPCRRSARASPARTPARVWRRRSLP